MHEMPGRYLFTIKVLGFFESKSRDLLPTARPRYCLYYLPPYPDSPIYLSIYLLR